MSDTPPEAGARPAAPKPNTTPWWVPEARAWVAAALFGLALYVLYMIGDKPDLSKNTLFVSIATGIFGGGGLLAVIGFYYVASKKDRGDGGAP